MEYVPKLKVKRYKVLKITVDTNIIIDHQHGKFDLVALSKRHSLDIVVVTVTERELKSKVVDIIALRRLDEAAKFGEPRSVDTISETFVLGESALGKGSLGGQTSVDSLETILKILTDGSFPKRGRRQSLNRGERNQLRDAMILEAHIREKRDLFVSNDRRAFIGNVNNEKRRQLEQLFSIQIMRMDEFLNYLKEEVG